MRFRDPFHQAIQLRVLALVDRLDARDQRLDPGLVLIPLLREELDFFVVERDFLVQVIQSGVGAIEVFGPGRAAGLLLDRDQILLHGIERGEARFRRHAALEFGVAGLEGFEAALLCQWRRKNRPWGGVKVDHFGSVRSLSPKSTGGPRARCAVLPI